MRQAPHHELPTGQVLVGDALRWLRHLPSASIDTVVTSPPYFLLRDYGASGQIGNEETVEQWVERLRAVLREISRVLKPDGSVWLNLGDTYSRHQRQGAEPKSLVLGPERLLLALVDDGWVVRNKIVWAKTNPMPSSIGDRLSSTWEPLYLLVRNRRYFFDLDAIRVPARSAPSRPSPGITGGKYAPTDGQPPAWAGPTASDNAGLVAMKARGHSSHPLGKNPGDVWSLPTASYRGAHFATFPAQLVERPLLATCPQQVCRSCGSAWRRATSNRSLGHVAIMGALRKACACPDRAWQAGVVLDPFFGAGTVGLVAERLGRRWLGIELNGEFAHLAEQRIKQDQDDVE